MKTLILLLLLTSPVTAADWTVVDSKATKASTVSDQVMRIEVTLKNTSKNPVEVREDSLSKGAVLANYFYTNPKEASGFVSTGFSHWTLFARPCHPPENYLTIKAGETVKLSVPEYSFAAGKKVRLELVGKKQKLAAGYITIPTPES